MCVYYIVIIYYAYKTAVTTMVVVIVIIVVRPNVQCDDRVEFSTKLARNRIIL